MIQTCLDNHSSFITFCEKFADLVIHKRTYRSLIIQP